MYKVIIFTSFIILTVPALAQEPGFNYTDTSLIKNENNNSEYYSEEDDDALPSDTLAYINEKDVAWDTINAIRSRPAFAYTSYLDSMLKAKQRDNKATEKKATKKQVAIAKFFSSGILKFILWILGIFFIGAIIYHVFLNNLLFRKRSHTAMAVAEERDEENMGAAEFYHLMTTAATSGDYRLATRFWYLHTLRMLCEEGFLQSDPAKTNADYFREIHQSNKPAFKKLLNIYERTWYGQSEISAELYSVYSDEFINFAKALHN